MLAQRSVFNLNIFNSFRHISARYSVIIFVFLALNFAYLTATAEQISGIVSKNAAGEFFFKSTGSQTSIPITATTIDAQNSLQPLKSLDYIQGHGFVSNNTMMLESIDFVGLHDLLGPWHVNNSVKFHFKNFQTLYIINNHNKSESSRQKLDYSLAPNNEHSWSLFISDKNSMLFGTLTLEDTLARIQIYNTDNGKIEISVKLRRPSKKFRKLSP